MRISIAAFAMVTALSATPLVASAQCAVSAATFTHYDVVDPSGRIVGELLAGPHRSLVLAPANAASALVGPRPDALGVDYSKALTPQQFDDTYRAAHDAFFDVEHSP